MAKTWQAMPKDLKILEMLYNQGPMVAHKIIAAAVPELNSYGYKRLWYMKQLGLLRAEPYLVKMPDGRKLKRGTFYGLTDKGYKAIKNLKDKKALFRQNGGC